MIDYMGLKVRHTDSSETGGSSYILHVSHAAQAIAAGHCSVALITLAGPAAVGTVRPLSRRRARGSVRRLGRAGQSQQLWDVRGAAHA